MMYICTYKIAMNTHEDILLTRRETLYTRYCPYNSLSNCLIHPISHCLHNYLQYNLKLEEIKAKFEEYGEIKEMCDLIDKRGILFISYVSH